MTLITGSNGQLRHNGVPVAKCREYSIDINRDALESSVLGSFDREYIEGMRGATGSATVLYDADDPGTVEIANSIFRDGGPRQSITMILDTNTSKGLAFNAITTQVSTPVRVGDVTACSLSFQITGPIDGRF